jgi:hypothetical protein
MDEDGAPDNQFSRASLFGIYLTLAFCVLTQPVGSLLMGFPIGEPVSLAWRQALLPLQCWRLNPIACGAEGWLIIVTFAERCINGWVSLPQDAPLRLRLKRLLDKMFVVATALLILRAQYVDESRDWMLSELKRLVPGDGPENEPMLALPAQQTDAVTPGNASAPATPKPYRQKFDGILHPGVLASKQGWVDAVAVLGLCTTIVKLIAARIPWQLRIGLLMMVGGWLAVELLMLVGHSREFESVDRRIIAREILGLHKSFPWLDSTA